mmetsp:Transcript_40167/g.72280  ORF Transcript_40167/g.72280 Transcript_40167/m.72280 type:complete len:362 (+) Transcript_40167:45-1130(+)
MASGPAWSWPPWCLNHRDGQIEVFVNDEESGTARWVPGMAQTRIVDPNGQDAYLQVLYVWDGEEYVEDFAPPQVRAVGSAQTVEDLIRTGEIQSTRSLRETPAPADTSQQLAEVVLECVEADGVDPSKVPKEERALAFKVKPGDPAFLYCKIGRQHQPEFFERMVPVKENLTSISRTHFELNYEDDGSNPCPKIRQLSRHALDLLWEWRFRHPLSGTPRDPSVPRYRQREWSSSSGGSYYAAEGFIWHPARHHVDGRPNEIRCRGARMRENSWGRPIKGSSKCEGHSVITWPPRGNWTLAPVADLRQSPAGRAEVSQLCLASALPGPPRGGLFRRASGTCAAHRELEYECPFRRRESPGQG